MADTKSKSSSKSKSQSSSKSGSQSKRSDEDKAREEQAQARSEEMAAASRPASSDIPAVTGDKEWPVPPGTKNPPNVKVDGKDVGKLDQGLEDLEIVQVDGANAVLRLGKEERLVGQADLYRASKKVAKGIQETY